MAGSSKVKVNSANFSEIQDYVTKASEKLDEAENIWGEKFDNLYANFVESDFLNSLYKDAESTFYSWSRGLSAVGCVASGALLGLSFGPIGGIIGAVIGAVFGVTMAIINEPTWLTISKETFENLLLNCRNGNDDNYIKITNLITKMYNVQVSLEKIKTKVNEYQQLYANLNATAESMGVKTSLASDGTTVLSVDTEVTIDGQTIELSTSEALNAFYTYENTVMSAMIEADILERTYGYDIDYNSIVKNANSFMTDTINSGLYSHTFIDALLPNYTPDESAAYDAASAATGVDNDKLKNLMSDVSNLNIFSGLGLMSAALIGKVNDDSQPSNDSNSGGPSTPPTNPDTTPDNSGTSPSNPGVTPGGTTPDNDDKDDDDADEEVKNDIEIEEISDEEIPESVENEEEKDYDALAKEQFEFETDYEELLEHRSDIIEDVESKYDSGDLESLREELKEYGYNNAEIDAILQDKFTTIKAIVQGDQDAQIAKIAHELAKADGVEDFTSSFEERPDYSLLEDDGPSDKLMLASEDENVVKLYDEMKEARDAYNKTIDETNEVLKEVTDNKQSMEELKAKYEKEYGEDTTKWTEDAANEYNEAIKEYNESVEKATKQMETLEQSKSTYETARKEFDTAREEYYTKQKNGDNSSEDSTDSSNDDNSGSDSTDTKPDAGGADLTPSTDGITYLDGTKVNSGVYYDNQQNSVKTIDDSVTLTDSSIEIK